MRAVLLTRADWHRYAPRVGVELAAMAAGSGGRFAASDISGAIIVGRMQGWLAMEGDAVAALLVTEIAQYPQFRALRVIGVAGAGMHRWVRLWPEIVAHARALGCERLEAMAPARYNRLLARLGMAPFHVLSEMPI